MRVLWVGDAGCSTGFARCTHAACDALVAAGHEVEVLAINYFGRPDITYEYRMWPCVDYTDGGRDVFGVTRLPRLVRRLQPDVVVLLNDPWNVEAYMQALESIPAVSSDLNEYTRPPVVGWLAVDADNQDGEACNGLSHVVTWTSYGLEQLRLGGCTVAGSVVPLGVDHDLYLPRDRTEARTALQGLDAIRDPSTYVVGVVGRNQPRKRIDLTLQYFYSWLRQHPNDDAYLLMHVAPTGDRGVDIRRLCEYYGGDLDGRVLLSTPPVGLGVDDQVMPYLYSAMDVYLTTSAGEGWGLTALEAMACGTPCIVPDFAAHSEWGREATTRMRCGARQPNAPLNSHAYTVGAVPDEEQCVMALQYLYSRPDRRQELAEAGCVVAAQYDWRKTGRAMVEVLEATRRPHWPRQTARGDHG